MVTTAKQLADRLAKVQARQKALAAAKTNPNSPSPTSTTKSNAPTPTPEQVFGAPNVRRGENTMGSRGYEVVRVIKALRGGPGSAAWENAKLERDLASRLKSAYGDGAALLDDNNIQCPFSTAYMAGDNIGRDLVAETKSLFSHSTKGFDPDELRYAINKSQMSDHNKADVMSWLDQSVGGTLVPPAVQGEFIDLWRPEVALLKAGVTQIPLPPGGLTLPRQTSATVAYWGQENQASTASAVPGTGASRMSPKKLIVRMTMPNDLLRYGGPAVEAFVRSDIAKTAGLAFDKGCLEETGGDLKPLGIINTPNIGVVTPTTVATDGNTLAEQDLLEFLSKIAASNGKFEKFVMNPRLYYKLLGRRNDAVTASDKKGAFTFSPMRQAGDKQDFEVLSGYPVVLSNQVSTTRTKGSGTTLTYVLAGQFSDCFLGMFGAMEFAAATQGDTAFANDQTVIRCIMIGDFLVRHAGAIAWADSLLIA